MKNRMSLQARQELLEQVRKRYHSANRIEKGKILDGFIAATAYPRKYVIGMLGKTKTKLIKKIPKKRDYSTEVSQALLTIWNATNNICSKRLVPFLPDFIEVLERYGHLSLPPEVKIKLLSISPATVDRLLKPIRQQHRGGISTTKSGSLLKNQIKVRTFADWDNVVPGFLEADLVAHCGDRTDGAYLNTFVLTDIASGWTEFLPLIHKSEANVIEALGTLQELLPFILLGLDTDNGSEFINYGLLKFCETKKITFTRSRAYRKNDQAHVEEKNGSIVRKLIGYDRYEGENAWKALADVYAVVRLYVNFFQPSMKLISKERLGAKVHKRYDKAQTPYQRLITSAHINQETKDRLLLMYNNLDPVILLERLKMLQNEFWGYAWRNKITAFQKSLTDTHEGELPTTSTQSGTNREYRRTSKPRKPLGTRIWKTRKDPFEEIWDRLQIQLALDPCCTSKMLLEQLIKQDASKFSIKHLRTLQRRVAKWRMDQIKYQDPHHFVSLANSAMNHESHQHKICSGFV